MLLWNSKGSNEPQQANRVEVLSVFSMIIKIAGADGFSIVTRSFFRCFESMLELKIFFKALHLECVNFVMVKRLFGVNRKFVWILQRIKIKKRQSQRESLKSFSSIFSVSLLWFSNSEPMQSITDLLFKILITVF